MHASPSDHGTNIGAQVQIEQVRLILARGTIAVALAPLLAITVCVTLWSRAASPGALLVWLVAVCLGYTLRILGKQRFVAARIDAIDYAWWSRFLVGTSAATGVLWGLLCYVPLLGDPWANKALVGLVISGTVSAAVTTLAPHRGAALAFLLPCMALATIDFLLEGVYGIAAMALLFFAVGINAIGHANRNLVDNLRLRLAAQAHETIAKDSESRLRTREAMERIVADVRQRYISNANIRDLFEHMLGTILQLTQSEYGFIGEVLQEDGKPYLKTHAMTNIAWDDATRQLYAKNSQTGFEFRNLQNLFGAAILQSKPVIANEPATDPRQGGLPPGHPALNAFLGAPIFIGEQMVGLVGIANRVGGYDGEILEQLAPLLSSAAQFIDANRADAARREAELHVARMHAQLSAFIQHTPAAVAMLDNKLTILAHSQRWRTDFNVADEWLVGKHLYTVLPDIPALWRESYERALHGGIESEEADPYIRSDGMVRWFKWEARPWFEAEQTVGGIVLFCEDVTEVKRTHDALHARDQLLKKLAARIPGMLFQMRYQPDSQRNTLLYASEGSRAIFGLSPEELAENPNFLLDVCHPEDRLMLESTVAQTVREVGLLRIEHRIILPPQAEQPARVRWLHVETALERLADASLLWHGYIQDVTERHTADAATRALADRLRLAGRAHNLGVWDWVLATNQLSFDERMYEIFAADSGAALDLWALWRSRIHPADRQRMADEMGRIHQLADGGVLVFATELRISLPDGTIRRIRARATIDRDANNQPVRVVGINWDMGEESELATAPHHLQVLSYIAPQSSERKATI